MFFLEPNPFPLLLLWLCIPWIGVGGILYNHLDLWQHRSLSLWCSGSSLFLLGYFYIMHPTITLKFPWGVTLVLEEKSMILGAALTILMTFMLWIYPRALKLFCTWGFFCFLVTLKNFFFLFLFMEVAFLLIIGNKEPIVINPQDMEPTISEKEKFSLSLTHYYVLWRYCFLVGGAVFLVFLNIFDVSLGPLGGFFPFLNIIAFILSPLWPFYPKEREASQNLLGALFVTGLLWQLSFWVFYNANPHIRFFYWKGFTSFFNSLRINIFSLESLWSTFFLSFIFITIFYVGRHHHHYFWSLGFFGKRHFWKPFRSFFGFSSLLRRTKELSCNDHVFCCFKSNTPEEKKANQDDIRGFFLLFLKPWFLCNGLFYILLILQQAPFLFSLLVLFNSSLVPIMIHQLPNRYLNKTILQKNSHHWFFYSLLSGFVTPYLLSIGIFDGFVLCVAMAMMMYQCFLFICYFPPLPWEKPSFFQLLFLFFNTSIILIFLFINFMKFFNIFILN